MGNASPPAPLSVRLSRASEGAFATLGGAPPAGCSGSGRAVRPCHAERPREELGDEAGIIQRMLNVGPIVIHLPRGLLRELPEAAALPSSCPRKKGKQRADREQAHRLAQPVIVPDAAGGVP